MCGCRALPLANQSWYDKSQRFPLYGAGPRDKPKRSYSRERCIPIADFSFDVVSKVDMAEVVNAVAQATKEMENRFDFKGSKSSITLNEKDSEITLVSDDEGKLRNVVDIVQGRLVKREVPLKNLEYGKIEPAAMGTVRQVITLRSGIPADKAKQMTKLIRDSKIKVNAQIQGDQVRVAGAKKDDLQATIKLLKENDFGIELQFVNYR